MSRMSVLPVWGDMWVGSFVLNDKFVLFRICLSAMLDLFFCSGYLHALH